MDQRLAKGEDHHPVAHQGKVYFSLFREVFVKVCGDGFKLAERWAKSPKSELRRTRVSFLGNQLVYEWTQTWKLDVFLEKILPELGEFRCVSDFDQLREKMVWDKSHGKPQAIWRFKQWMRERVVLTTRGRGIFCSAKEAEPFRLSRKDGVYAIEDAIIFSWRKFDPWLFSDWSSEFEIHDTTDLGNGFRERQLFQRWNYA